MYPIGCLPKCSQNTTRIMTRGCICVCICCARFGFADAHNGFDSAEGSHYASNMKIIVADKISERGIELLRETGWEIVLPAAAALAGEIANADGLIVRSGIARRSCAWWGARVWAWTMWIWMRRRIAAYW